MHVLHVNNNRITVKFCSKLAHVKPIPHTKQNSDIFTDVIDNDVIILKFERFHRKAFNFKRLYLGSLWMKLSTIWHGY